MRRWFLALAQAAILLVIIFGVIGLVDLIMPPAEHLTRAGVHWTMIGGVICWVILGAIFYRLGDPEEL